MPIGTDCNKNTNNPSGKFQLSAYARNPANTEVYAISRRLGWEREDLHAQTA